MSLNAVVKDLFFQVGFNIRRLDESRLGQDAFRDMKRLTKSPLRPVIFDVGANEGQTIEAFRSCFGRPVIHAFEPGGKTFQALQSKVGGTEDLFLNNVAMGARSEKREFLESTHSPMSSFLKPGKTCWGTVTGHREVEINTIDDYCREAGIERIDILKCDTQGFDLEVLKGAARMIEENRVHLVHIELVLSEMYEDLPRLDTILAFLFDRGYSVVSFYDFFYEGDRASWTDALFINPRDVGPEKAPTAANIQAR